MGKLDGKTAIVTGATGGLGSAFCLALAEAGANVGVADRTGADAAQALVADLKARGHNVSVLMGDVTDPAAVAAMFAQADRDLGPLDILVNNAGIDGHRARAWEADPMQWRRAIEVNLFGAFHCAREALSRMVPRKTGVVVNISSVHEVIPWGGYSAYAASKAGVGMMTKTLAQEAAEFGVRVLALAPGAIRTPINKDVWSDPAGLADLNKKIPMGRIGEPEEAARLLVSLASDDASYLTGTTVMMDGGMSLYADFSHGG